MRKPILIVDDSEDTREFFTAALEAEGFSVVAISSGQEALDLLADRSDFSLILLDISMPVLSGIEAAARLRESACRAKVIFLTVHDDPTTLRLRFQSELWAMCSNLALLSICFRPSGRYCRVLPLSHRPWGRVRTGTRSRQSP